MSLLDSRNWIEYITSDSIFLFICHCFQLCPIHRQVYLISTHFCELFVTYLSISSTKDHILSSEGYSFNAEILLGVGEYIFFYLQSNQYFKIPKRLYFHWILQNHLVLLSLDHLFQAFVHKMLGTQNSSISLKNN